MGVARFLKIEDLALSAMVTEDNSPESMEDVNTLKLRRETQQLLRLIRCCVLYFLVLTLVYLFQTIVCYSMLDEDRIERQFSNPTYGMEILRFVREICIMNIVHSLTLMSLGVFMLLATRRFKVLNRSHYVQLAVLSVAITIIYFVPIVFIAMRAYTDTITSSISRAKSGYQRFFDVLLYILLRTDMGIGGFLLAFLVHVQLYMLVFAMMWCASHVKDIVERVKFLKESNAGTYKGLELRGVSEISVQTEQPRAKPTKEDV